MLDSGDSLLRYTFGSLPVRGELVQLTGSYQRLTAGHNYPAVVQQMLGELMAVASLLTATLKFEGHINLQVQGNGCLNFMTVNGSHDQQLRGLARLTSEPMDDTFSGLTGNKAYLIITLSPAQGERYQGVVEVRPEDTQLNQVIERYFAQSEQLRTRIWLHADADFCGGMLLQALPGEEQDDDSFQHLEALTDTIRSEELKTLEGTQILHRLYHEQDVHLFPAMPVRFHCGCSHEKSMQALYSVPVAELKDILQEDGEIKLTCDYCLTEYRYNEEDVAAIQGHQPPTHTQ
ncbi:Hsp33 family molecular chaperone HslO [Aliidiomarina minuta]|uniref:Hsp33 family molecular chaperone HslO n=1 Tax=Aliidiomarina minuta TaxID=880057 RepID=A0A432W8P7_9GAMM|nr:Hsp33 family molecular chaperone HslO [Aliidiomarina minuta]RUO26439.1 Hsp33 family molecular chaperone HslO [Aliidiomarina minuta]